MSCSSNNAKKVGAPRFGVGRTGSPRIVPISPFSFDLFRFIPICAPCFRECPDLFWFPPFSSDLFRFTLLVFGDTSICSDLFRFLPICSDLFSEQIKTNQNKSEQIPFCRPLLQIPEKGAVEKGEAFLTRVHAEGFVLCERTCFCLLSAF